ncbi:hypothetical protein [Xenorhabdus kozodoii]|uniref:Uncharacterized protein n=1 Tax=Xenorhabdus kozodoii TaxID=351676 RepID=A0A2D0LDK5_9GAMM|nr:hypothetical protein [Xenorhabdus kozodoii]PHM73774.1 hypothetical protein Xkoz_01601 [Xenorhabdus kozodoii]
MTIEEILHDAMQAARAVFKGKSCNVNYYDPNILPAEKRIFYSDLGIEKRGEIFITLRNRLLEEHLPYKEIYDFLNRNKNKLLVGNCVLLSLYALYYLKKKHKDRLFHLFYNPTLSYTGYQPLSLQIVGLLPPHGHAFVMVCPPSNNQDIPRLNMESPPNIFPQNAWICDPWAGIVCPAINYNDRWKIKMAEWSLRGKTIYINDNDNTDPEFNESPLGKYTYTAVGHGNKLTISNIEIYPDRKVIIDGEPSARKCIIM